MAEHLIEPRIPVLTDVIIAAAPSLPPLANRDEISAARDALVAELQTKLASRAFALTEQLLRSALSGMEATLLEQITAKLRRELPELIDTTLREHLSDEDPR